MIKPYAEWTFDEFVSFMMIHVAMADFEIAEEERDIILKSIPMERYVEMKNFHQKNSDYQNIQIIMSLKDKYCDTEENKKRLFDKLDEIFYSDGVFNINEKTMRSAMHLLLEN